MFFLICVATGTVIGMQTKVTKGEHAFVSAKSLGDLTIAVESEKAEIEKLKILFRENQQKLAEYENDTIDGDRVMQSVSNSLAEAKHMSGFSDVQGEGIVISMDDGVREIYAWEEASDIIVHDLDILLIINDLIGAGAEAISINGQRLINSTEISCSGHSIRINNQFFAQPFIIKAVGEASTLEASMTIPGSYGDLLKEYGLIFTVEKKDDIMISAYSEEINIKYMGIVKEGDVN